MVGTNWRQHPGVLVYPLPFTRPALISSTVNREDWAKEGVVFKYVLSTYLATISMASYRNVFT